MRSKLSTLLLCLCCLVFVVQLTGCNSTTKAVDQTGTESSDNTTVSKQEQYLDESVFPKDKVVDVKITIDEDDFQDMLDNASAEEYKEASVDYNGIHFSNIGIRTKGNLSLRSVVQMSDSDRYSFKLSFDEYVSQTLGGISKINLNNNYSDASYMREFLTYELAEKMGLPTPKYSFVNVYVNDKLWGFYLAIEQIGDSYLERHFGNSYGALYKGEMTGSGSDLLWIDDNPDSYTGLALKSKTTNDDILIDMINELNNGSDYEKYIDVEEALKYVALNVVTNNTDSYIGGNKQNYYLYEDDGVFSVLPWDYNMAFGGLGGGGGMGGGFGRGQQASNTETSNDAAPNDSISDSVSDSTAGPTKSTATDENKNAANTNGANGNLKETETAANNAKGNSSRTSLLIDEPTQGAVADRPLVAKLLAVDEYKELYHNIISEAVEGYLSNDAFTARVQEVASMIDSYVKADPTAFYTYDEYTQAVTQLISINASQADNITQQLDGTIASSGDGSGSGGGFGGGGMGGGAQMGNRQDGEQLQPALAAPGAEAVEGVQPPQDAQGQGMQSTDGNQPPEPPSGAPGDNGNTGAPPQTNTQDQMQQQGASDNDQTEGNADQGMPQGGRGGGGFGGGGDFGNRDFGGGGFGGGPMGGADNGVNRGAPNTQDSTKEALIVGISLVVLLLSCVFVNYFKRRRL
ncbi:Inner spore coat protein H [compost metagenome]